MKFSEVYIKSKISDYEYHDEVHPVDAPGQAYFPEMEDQKENNNEKPKGLNKVPEVKERLTHLESIFWIEYNKLVASKTIRWEGWDEPDMTKDQKEEWIDEYKSSISWKNYLLKLDDDELGKLKIEFLQQFDDYGLLATSKKEGPEGDDTVLKHLLIRILETEEGNKQKDRFFEDFTEFLSESSLNKIKTFVDYVWNSDINKFINNLEEVKDSNLYFILTTFFTDPSVMNALEGDDSFIKVTLEYVNEDQVNSVVFQGKLLKHFEEWATEYGISDDEKDNYVWQKYHNEIEENFSERNYSDVHEQLSEYGVEDALEHLSGTIDAENELELNEIFNIDKFYNDSYSGYLFPASKEWITHLSPIVEQMTDAIGELPDEAKKALMDQLPESNKESREFAKAKKRINKRMNRECPDEEVEYSMNHREYPDDIEEASQALGFGANTMSFASYINILDDPEKKVELNKKIKYYREVEQGHSMDKWFEAARRRFEESLGRPVSNKEVEYYSAEQNVNAMGSRFNIVKKLHTMIGRPIPFEDAVAIIQNPEHYQAIEETYMRERASREEKQRFEQQKREEEAKKQFEDEKSKVDKTKVTNLEGNNQAIMLNIINKLRQRGNVTKQELEQFFNKYKGSMNAST